jgi:hypothetical protein
MMAPGAICAHCRLLRKAPLTPIKKMLKLQVQRLVALM